MAHLRIGVVQTTTGIDPRASAEAMAGALREAAAQGAAIAFTPEMSGRLDRDRERLLAPRMLEVDEPTLAAARDVAREHGLWVALGSLAVRRAPELPLLVNRSYLIDAEGAIVARYDKIHRFDVDLGEGQRYRESATFEAGDRAMVAPTPWGPLAMSVCYDLRFPGLWEALAGARPVIAAVPAAFTRPTGAAHWEVLLRARAIELGAFVIAAAQTGRHEDGRETWGHSLVVGPWGAVLLDMGEAPGVAVLDLDLDAVAEARRRIPSLDHRRPFTGP